jgi:hypothetical protein
MEPADPRKGGDLAALWPVDRSPRRNVVVEGGVVK